MSPQPQSYYPVLLLLMMLTPLQTPLLMLPLLLPLLLMPLLLPLLPLMPPLLLLMPILILLLLMMLMLMLGVAGSERWDVRMTAYLMWVMQHCASQANNTCRR